MNTAALQSVTTNHLTRRGIAMHGVAKQHVTRWARVLAASLSVLSLCACSVLNPPARMLGPLLVSAAQQTGAFAAVVLASGTAAGDLRLNTELLQLQHNFQTSPSRVQLRLRIYLSDEKTRKVLASKDFSAEAAAASDTPQGGVAAANAVVQQVLTQIAQFLADQPK